MTTTRKASFWKRFIAFFVDNLLITVLIVVVGRIFGFPDIIEDWFAFVSYYLYNIFCDYYNQSTLGKMVMKLRVIEVNGQKPGLKNSIYRNFGKIISAIPLFYGFLRILAPHQRQTIHDEIGKCLVIDMGQKED